VSTLFDISPEEPTKGGKSRLRRPAVAAHKKTDSAPIYKRELPTRPIKALGRLDHVHECGDTLCRGSAHDIIHEDRGEWLIQCCFCHTAQWVPVVPGHLQPKQDEFVFRDGRFAGLTIDEALEQPRGRDYVTWAAANHPRPAVRDACENHIDASPVAS
jgi:hypothetical protein